MEDINSVGVVGSGQMGSGIAQLAAIHGLNVWLVDIDPDALSRAAKSISNSIHRLISKGHLSQVITNLIWLSTLSFGYQENYVKEIQVSSK